MADKASSDGHYIIGGIKFRIRKGDIIPEGATFKAGAFGTTDTEEKRALKAAPENKAKQSAPENRAKSKDA